VLPDGEPITYALDRSPDKHKFNYANPGSARPGNTAFKTGFSSWPARSNSSVQSLNLNIFLCHCSPARPVPEST